MCSHLLSGLVHMFLTVRHKPLESLIAYRVYRVYSPPNWIEYRVYGDLIIIYLKGTIGGGLRVLGLRSYSDSDPRRNADPRIHASAHPRTR